MSDSTPNQTDSPLATPLCDLLGIRYPIVKAGMAGGTDTPELVAAVSAAGGLGLLGSLGLAPDQLRAAIRAIRARTDRPFGVNVIVHPPEPPSGDATAARMIADRFRRELDIPTPRGEPAPPPMALPEQLAVVFEEGVPVLNTMGDPTALIGPAHAAGMTVLAIVTTVEEAVLAATAGADAVVAQGAEAGGLRGTFRLGPGGEVPLIGTMALVPAVVDAVSVPVVAAGGIMDGSGLVAALALGASGVLLGTRFAAARESGIFAGWRERLLAASELETVVSRAATGRPARSLHNRLVDEQLRSGAEPLNFPRQAAALADVWQAAREREAVDYLYLAAGQGVRRLRQVEGAGDIVADLVDHAESIIAARFGPPSGGASA